MESADGLAHELAFARSFIEPTKRNRYEQLLQSAKGRKKIIFGFDHMGDLDPRFARRVPHDWTTEKITCELKARGAPRESYVFSTIRELDRQVLPLADVIKEIYGRGMGTCVSCIPGRLGYFEGEEPGFHVFLER